MSPSSSESGSAVAKKAPGESVAEPRVSGDESLVQTQDLWWDHHGAAARVSKQTISYQRSRGAQFLAAILGSTSRNPERAGVDAVASHFQMQRLVVHSKQPRRLTLVASRGLKRQPDRLALGLGDGPTGDLLQRWPLLSSSRAPRSYDLHEGANVKRNPFNLRANLAPADQGARVR